MLLFKLQPSLLQNLWWFSLSHNKSNCRPTFDQEGRSAGKPAARLLPSTLNAKMDKPFQRLGSESNAHVGRDFEAAAKEFFSSKGIELVPDLRVPVGVAVIKKDHAFDLGCEKQKIIVECKSHRWTSGDNVPSAKMTVWNEAMYYFEVAPKEYRKVMFVLKDKSGKRNETLAEYYLRTYNHLIPKDVEFWEYDETTKNAYKLAFNNQIKPTLKSSAAY